MLSIHRHRGLRAPEVFRLFHDLDALQGEIFAAVAREPRHAPVARRTPERASLHDDGPELVLRAELPGVKADDLELTVEPRSLVLRVRRQPSEETPGRRGRRHAESSRVLALPCEVDPARVAARLERGVLLVTLPKVERPGPRRVDVASK